MPRDNEPDLGELKTEIKAELKRIGEEIKAIGERALAEAKKTGDMSAAIKPQVDELLVKQGELQARLLGVEQQLARRGDPDPSRRPSTLGAALTESEDFKAWLARGGMQSHNSGFVLPVPRATITGTPTTDITTVGVAPQLVPGIVSPPPQRLTVRDLIAPGTTSSNLIQYVKETGFTNAAAGVAEGAAKPESALTFDLVQAPVITLAHWMRASKQILDDMAALQSQINGRLQYGLKLVEETELLTGSGAANHLNGIYTQATAYSAPIVIATPTVIDVIRLMLLQAEIALYPSDGIVLHPSNWAAIELTKDSTGAYIFSNPQSLAQPALWGRPVVSTQSMAIDTALVGAFRLGAQIFDRESMNVIISSEDQDNFIKNLITIRCEERLALACYRPEAFIKNTDLSPP